MKKIISCLFLSFIVQYSNSTIPSGYYITLNGKQTASLKTELHNILMQDTSLYLSYGSGAGHTWQGFYAVDRDLSSNQVIDMYSNENRYFPVPNPTFVSFGQDLHIEHSLPKSWWGSHEWAAYKDLNHLYPADGSTNLSKSDNPLGVVSGIPTKNNGVSKIGPATYGDYIGNVFEPHNNFKGDFARTYFYMATAYEHYKNAWDTSKPENMMQNNTYPVFKPWAIDLLIQWHRQDPVSEKERTRTDKVYAIQLNRNPFIDYPELVEYIWGNQMGTVWNISTAVAQTDISDFDLIYNNHLNSFTIQSSQDISLDYGIFNMAGQKIMQNITNTNTQTQTNLSKGIYILVIKSKENQTEKIFKIIQN